MIKKLLILFLFAYQISVSQNTVGNVSITENAYDGYTLFTIHKITYLINNCGQVINEWTSNYLPGNAVYLLPNGNLLRAGREHGSSNITFGGNGGKIELFNWDGDVIWSYSYNTNNYRQHHDVYPMPNGNILILAATLVSEEDAISLGRNPSLLTEGKLYNERILEVEPIGTNDVNIIWEWNAIDHVIQDFDNTKNNFGVVADTPEKLDINFLNGETPEANWLHVNSIQYNHKLNQIVISSRNLSEIWVIDHSTTTLEAASSTGGLYGKGGDLLYRWGNPQSYRQGTEADRKLFGQHTPYFIEEGLEDEGKILLFNNGNGRSPSFSEVFIIDPPKTNEVYDYTENSSFGPETPSYVYSDLSETPSPFYSPIVSSAQRLPNGNLLICEGVKGYFFEIDSDNNKVWEYYTPINQIDGTISNQFDPSPNGMSFRALKYSKNYMAFNGRDLTPSSPIENNYNLNPCNALSIDKEDVDFVNIYPNPVKDFININIPDNKDYKVEVFNLLGKKIMEVNNQNKIDFSQQTGGVYFLKVKSENKIKVIKILKN
ncbi:aryl-sulfate sulfotransferase [Polaribacter sp. MSW13]|uniref:Aryl-sulfate sulfotransferase n=1 Tax=Polaribacter marinus TaxID=2916838 RepID=A0A9X2AIV4_9FLAO|nr:aryl-sulfate sulfotransferase [Polaribacter marinus]MCI2228462.1 aryl-sulfate sulfotransferase [Polaribacter marinus]